MPLQTLALPIAALLGVLGLIWLIQRLARTRTVAAWLPQAPRGAGRLRLVQSLPIDPKRRVVLIACDDREMLLLIGGPSDLVLTPEPPR